MGTRGAFAQDVGQSSAADERIDEIIVRGDIVGDLGLNAESESASRLGLSLLETPASVDIINSDVMQARGYQTVTEAVGNLAGVVVGSHPSAPSEFSMRGFDRAQITVLRDGLWIGPSSMVTRQQNTFNLDRIEVLRGPSSVLNGNGAVSGSVNTINKTAVESDDLAINGLASYGRYETYDVGVGVGGPLGENTYFRLDASQHASDGYVERADSHSTNVTGSVLWNVKENFSLKFSLDYLDDEIPGYWGTPLVPESVAMVPMTNVLRTSTGETIDGATRFTNYNVADHYSVADQLFSRLDLEWEIADDIVIRNTLFRYTADRNWKNAEGYVYCDVAFSAVFPCDDPGSVGQIQRYYGYFILDHEQEQYGNRFTINVDAELSERQTRWVFGYEFNDIDFVRTRGFRRSVPIEDGDSVDLYDPIPGEYGPIEWRGESPTQINNRALFAEGLVELTDSLNLVAAVRYEELDLTRRDNNLEPGTPVPTFASVGDEWDREFQFWGYRFGATYEVREGVVLYGQISNAKDPVSSNIFLANSSNDFDLTDAIQWEIGGKAIFFDGDVQATLSYFNIERDDVSERISLDAIGMIGGRESHGVEFQVAAEPSDQLSVGLTAGYTDAEFVPSANAVAIAGNTPPNVPEFVANGYLSYRELLGSPFDIGISARYVSDRFANNTNTTEMLDYFVMNAIAGFTLNENIRFTARVNNIFDEEYIPWSDVFYLQNNDPSFLYANQLPVGAPRTYSVTMEVNF